MSLLDWKTISTKILASRDDQGKLTQLLSDLETDVTTFNTRFSELEKTSATQSEQIDSLQKTNMNLFLRQGNQVPDEAVRSTEQTLSYDDLFDENGGLK